MRSLLLLVLVASLAADTVRDDRTVGDRAAGWALQLPPGIWEWTPTEGPATFRQLSTGRRVAVDRELLQAPLTAVDYAALVLADGSSALPDVDLRVGTESVGVFTAQLHLEGLLEGIDTALVQWFCPSADGAAMLVVTLSGPRGDFAAWESERGALLASFTNGAEAGALLADAAPPAASVRTDPSRWAAAGAVDTDGYTNPLLGLTWTLSGWELEAQDEGGMLVSGTGPEGRKLLLSAELLAAPLDLPTYLAAMQRRLETRLLTTIDERWPRTEGAWATVAYRLGEHELVQVVRVSVQRSSALVLTLRGPLESQETLLAQAESLRAGLALSDWE